MVEGAAGISNVQKAVATEEATTGGTSDPRRRRRPVRSRVVFHVTGFGVFNGVADNPTTHLVNELPGELRARRSVSHNDDHGHDRLRRGVERGDLRPGEGASLPVLGGIGEDVFEVRSCSVLDVSAKVGGRQLRELHSSSSVSVSPRGKKEATALAADECGAPGAGIGCGSVGDQIPERRVGGTDVGVVAVNESGSRGSGVGDVANKKSADEGGGPGGIPAQNGGGGAPTKVRGSGGGSDGIEDGDEHGGQNTEEEDAVTTVFIHCGVNGGTSRFALETQGFNEATFRVPDEGGYCPSFAPVDEDNPDTGHCRVTTIPVADVLQRLEAMGWGPEHVAESKDAGRFVCNYVYYTSLGLCERPTAVVAPAAVAAETEGAVETAAPSEKSPDAFSTDGNGNTSGSGKERGCGTADARSRHSLFIHVPPFEALAKDKQLALLVACLSAIATALSPSSSSSSPAQPTDNGPGVDLGNSPVVAAATTATSAPPLFLSSYEAAVLAEAPDPPDPSSPGPSEIPATEGKGDDITGEDALPVERAASTVPSIWDRPEPAEGSRVEEVDGDAGGASGGASGSVGRKRMVQFALDALADDDEENGRTGNGSSKGGEGGASYSRGEIGVDGDSEGQENQDGVGETPADATRRKLVETGFDGLDVDAAMATTGSDDTDVNMAFLLDITSLLPRGAPSEADGLYAREHSSNGGGRGGAIRPRARPAASSPAAAMGGVSPSWIGDVSPAKKSHSTGSSSGSGSGGFFSRLRRGHRRVPNAASAASEATADGKGERASGRRPRSVPRRRSSSSASAPGQQQEREYVRRTTGHVIRSHSPPPVRGICSGGAAGAVGGQRRLMGSESSASAAPVSSGWGETTPAGSNLRLALLVRLDLGMTPGTIAAQCSRAALAATRKAESGGRADTLAVWREAGESIVVLGAADAGSLETILAVGAAAHLPITMVRDKQAAWVGTVRADTCTVAAVGPAPISALRSVAGGLPVM